MLMITNGFSPGWYSANQNIVRDDSFRRPFPPPFYEKPNEESDNRAIGHILHPPRLDSDAEETLGSTA